MSISTLTIIQCLLAFLAYLFMVVFLPSLIFGRKFENLMMVERFFAYFTIGNFYMMNIVFVLELLKISNTFTLFLSTLAIGTAAYCLLYKIPFIKKVKEFIEFADAVKRGSTGIRTVLMRFHVLFIEWIKKTGIKLKEIFIDNLIDVILITLFSIFFIYVFGNNLIENLGYGVSDMPVHNWWINYLDSNQIFVDGIYPFGFHNVIYFMHKIFHFDVYVLLRVFWFVQTYFISILIFAVLRYCCKTKYAGYIGWFAFMGFDVFATNTFYRYHSTLPQEFGMLFIYPCLYFAVAFFKERKNELVLEKNFYGGKRKKKLTLSTWYLTGFALSFSMTLAVHFYCTMIAGILCMAIAIGYFFRFIQPKYCFRVILTFIASIFIAVLPMAVAFAQGTPLQGSLGWGMSVIQSSGDEDADSEDISGESDEDGTVTDDEQDGSMSGDSDGTVTDESHDSSETDGFTESGELDDGDGIGDITEDGTVYDGGDGTSEAGQDGGGADAAEEKGIIQRVTDFAYNFVNNITEAVIEFVFPDFTKLQVVIIYICSFVLLLVGIVMFIIKQYDYGAVIISTVMFMYLMSVLLASSRLGIIMLMDPARASIFYAYMIPLVGAVFVDCILFSIFGEEDRIFRENKNIHHFASLVMLGIVITATLLNRDILKKPYYTVPLETNEAIVCLTNIISESEDNTWTICSANDELQMGIGHGYHYELIEFLRQMETMADNAGITIPTKYVYFFVEKIPITYDFGFEYEGSGQSVSEEGADNPLPNAGGINMYKGRDRWIVMSRLYYWAQKFRQMYPNEMKVYLETDNFVCYKIEQNPYRLYNFAINYDYNTRNYYGE